MKIVLSFVDDASSLYLRTSAGLYRAARKHKWHIENIPVQDQTDIRGTLDFWKPIGCIVEGGNEHRLTRAAFRGCPVVFINRPPLSTDENASVVYPDDKACATAAIDTLSQGDIPHFACAADFTPDASWSRLRIDTFVTTLAARGMKADVFTPSTDERLNRTEYVRQLRPWLASLPKPCGIFAVNDKVASATIAACALEGLDVPNAVSVIGIDDDPRICCNVFPQLTSIRPDFAKCGYTAAELLLRAIRHPDWPGKIVTYGVGDIVRRGSTRAFALRDPEVSAALELIRLKACAGLSASNVHRQFSCSRRYADNRFKKITGQTILQSIHETRIKRACELLVNPQQELGPIANLCGYSSHAALCKFFKAKTGLTPGSWRKKRLGR